jgi:hypothetical protein
MFKNKEKRDTLLLLFMLVITVAFLLYVFIPTAKKPPRQKKPDKPKTHTETTTPNQTSPEKVLPDVPSEKNVLEELNHHIESELKRLYSSLLEKDSPFAQLDIDGLKKLPGKFQNQLVEKLFKFSFSDLNDYSTLVFPDTYSNTLKFNLYLSMFLVKIQEENIEAKFRELPDTEFANALNFRCYKLINNEVEYDHQLLPVIFYFRLLLQRQNLYPTVDNTIIFKQHIGDLLDLTPGKLLIQMRELLGFSTRLEKSTVKWVEGDGIFADDKKLYTNQNFMVIHFLHQEYMVFPDVEAPSNNQWINELCSADSGDIELKELVLKNEDPTAPLEISRIIYSPLKYRFIVLLKEYHPGSGTSREARCLQRLLTKRFLTFHQNFTIIDFLPLQMPGDSGAAEAQRKHVQKSLKAFGSFLKSHGG